MARQPVLPTLRAATFAAVCLGLSAGAHRIMSHAPIPVWALLIGAIAAYVPTRLAAGRGEQRLLGITGLMGGLQVALHLLFCFAQRGAEIVGGSGAVSGMAMPPGMEMPAGMLMPGTTSNVTIATAAAAATDPAASLRSMSTGMLLGHALAALVCAWWLWRGEAAVHAVIRCVVFRLRDVCVVVVLAGPPADRTPRSAWAGTRRHASRPLRSQWLRGTLAQRGPPVQLAAHL